MGVLEDLVVFLKFHFQQKHIRGVILKVVLFNGRSPSSRPLINMDTIGSMYWKNSTKWVFFKNRYEKKQCFFHLRIAQH